MLSPPSPPLFSSTPGNTLFSCTNTHGPLIIHRSCQETNTASSSMTSSSSMDGMSMGWSDFPVAVVHDDENRMMMYDEFTTPSTISVSSSFLFPPQSPPQRHHQHYHQRQGPPIVDSSTRMTTVPRDKNDDETSSGGPMVITPCPSDSDMLTKKKKKKSVSFDCNVQIRTHSITLGQHPYCPEGALTLDWKILQDETVACLQDHHNQIKMMCRRLSYWERKQRLQRVRGWSHDELEILMRTMAIMQQQNQEDDATPSFHRTTPSTRHLSDMAGSATV